jgi:hypothetical protein
MQQNGYLVANATIGATHDYFEKNGWMSQIDMVKQYYFLGGKYVIYKPT